MTARPRPRAAAWLFAIAAVIGLIHGSFSLYWAFGGTFLVDTIGDWVTDLQAEGPGVFEGTFLVIGVVKLAAALIPLTLLLPRPRLRRTIRLVSWIGATLLALYALMSIVMAGLALAGATPMVEGLNERSAWWTTLLWQPLFLVWGASLDAALFLTRKPR